MPDSVVEPRKTSNRLLAVVAVILVTAALKLSQPVLLPATLGVVLVVIVWPLQTRLERYVWRWVALVATTLVVLLAIGVIIYTLVWSVQQLTARGPQLAGRLERLTSEFMAWARLHAVPLPQDSSPRMVAQRLPPLATAVAREAYDALVLIGFTLAFFLLGLLEVREIEARVARGFRPAIGEAIMRTGTEIAGQFRQYLVAIIASSAVGGLATGLFSFAMGVDLALLWGVVSGLLNLIPTVGPAISIVPPTLFAVLQFDGLARPAVVFAGLGLLQFFIGNFVDPKIGGRVLSLSPFLILFAVVFWGWLWGSLGAVIAMPLVAALVITCRQFKSTRWIAVVLSGERRIDHADSRQKTASSRR
ncbi:MAG: AI-2E family transporter [Gemmatimonadota bacterium]|nr:AI-2E family transporter [Gemmatimonadota bacterium]